MTDSFVIGLDSSTTSTKALAVSRDGVVLGEGRADIPLSNPKPGYYEQDPNDWWQSLVTSIKHLGEQVDLTNVASMAISNQRETAAYLNNQGEAIRPAIVWLDERCRSLVKEFAASIGEDKIHQLTGKPPDATPVCYKVEWLRRNEPENFAKIEKFSDVAATLTYYLTGKFASSWASADPMGYYDIVTKQWATPILDKLEIEPTRLPEPVKPCSIIGKVNSAAAVTTGLPEGTILAAGGGDGQCAGLGVGVNEPNSAYINLGTAVVAGVWSKTCEFNRSWRNLTSASGDGYILESVLRSGTFLVNWLVQDIFGLKGGVEDFIQLDKEASLIAPGSNGLLLMPYWLGVMTPHWNNKSRGAILGLSAEHQRAHLYRAVLEGIAFEQACFFRLLESHSGIKVKTANLVGGGAQSDLWAQIFGDVVGLECNRLNTVEASAIGAAMTAAVAANWYADANQASVAMGGQVTSRFKPQEQIHNIYQKLLDKFSQIYPATETIFTARN